MAARISDEEINSRLGVHRNNEYVLSGPSKGVKTKTSILHKECGTIWEVIPSDVIRNKSTCPKCCKAVHKTPEQAREYLLSTRGGEYTLDINSYTFAKSKCNITHVCGYSWNTLLYDVAKGNSSCIACGSGIPNKSGFKPNKPASLYFIAFPYLDAYLYKIGVTNNTVLSRHKPDRHHIELIWQINFDLGYYARGLEQQILLNNKENLYNSGALASGNTETMTIFIDTAEVLSLIDDITIKFEILNDCHIRSLNRAIMYNY